MALTIQTFMAKALYTARSPGITMLVKCLGKLKYFRKGFGFSFLGGWMLFI